MDLRKPLLILGLALLSVSVSEAVDCYVCHSSKFRKEKSAHKDKCHPDNLDYDYTSGTQKSGSKKSGSKSKSGSGSYGFYIREGCAYCTEEVYTETRQKSGVDQEYYSYRRGCVTRGSCDDYEEGSFTQGRYNMETECCTSDLCNSSDNVRYSLVAVILSVIAVRFL